MYEIINGLYKLADCQHCGDEWEYQCGECEKAEEDEKEMSELEKLEFIHSTLQEVLQSEYKDMIETSIEFVEEIREKYYEIN